MTTDPLATARRAAESQQRAHLRADEHRKVRDAAIRAALDAGHRPNLVAAATGISRSAVRKIAAQGDGGT